MSLYLREIVIALTIGASLLLSAIGLGFVGATPSMTRWNKRFFMCFFTILALYACNFVVEPFVYGDPDSLQIEMIIGFLESLLASILIIMPTPYLLNCCGETWRKSMLFRGVMAIWTVFLTLLVICQFTDIFYYYSPDDAQFQIGSLYPLLVVPLPALLFLCLAGVIRRRDKLSKRQFYAFLVFLVPLAISIIVHMFTPIYLQVYIAVAISSIAMFVIVVSEQNEQYILLQQETARQRAKIAVLQMRPHFIHNTMTSIYYLCEQDPKKAQQVTMDFNTYLRKNFNAIANDETIPFSEELEHTRAYLAVEEAQFANKLVVEFDTPHTQFRVPPLTLQPLAENAVKHGMGPNTVPLCVSIRTRKVGSASEVVVEDNGPGFDHAIAKDPHTTLANIRQRLELMCNGKLVFEHHPGGGTVARATVPDSNHK